MNVRAILIALLSAAAFYFCAVQPANAAPALWVVKSPVGKVYLFGTVHLLRRGIPWRSPELEAAIKDSQDLYLEIADPGNTAAGVSSLVKVAFDNHHLLSTKISKADEALLNTEAKRYGLGDAAMFERMQPWLVYMMLSVMPLLHSGYSTDEGVDLQIRKDFVSASKPIRGFETFDMQAHILADLPEATQIELLDNQLKALSKDNGVKTTDAVVNAWQTGNEEELTALLGADESQHSLVEQRMLTDRNKAWVKILADRLQRPGTSLVCVGAAHLVGPEGVPALLSGLGFAVSRIPTTEPVVPATSPSPSAPAQSTSSPTPIASATPIPQTLTPPPGWKSRNFSQSASGFKTDKVWISTVHRGVIMSGHIDIPGVSTMDLTSFDALMHEGLISAAGEKGVAASKRVKICHGSQDGTYSKVTISGLKEDVVLALSDRGYLAEYVRTKNEPDDPKALASLLTLCAP